MIQQAFDKQNIILSETQRKKFEIFLEIFLEKNLMLNLSSIRDIPGVIEKHFLDSLILTKFEDLNGKRLADVGTGGGFPGIPLKIFFGENLEITFIDSVAKKLKAVEEFCSTLDFKNCTFLHGRGEVFGKKEYKEYFDIVVSRAVAYLPDLLKFTLPLLKKGGTFIAYKMESQKEIYDSGKMLKKYGAYIQKIEYYELAGQKRVLIFIKK